MVVLVKEHPTISPSATTCRNLEGRGLRSLDYQAPATQHFSLTSPLAEPHRQSCQITQRKSNEALTHLGQSTEGGDLLPKGTGVGVEGRGLPFPPVTPSHKENFLPPVELLTSHLETSLRSFVP